MAVAALASLPFVVIAVSAGQLPPPWLELADVALGPDDPTLAPIITTLEDHPVATTTLALLLRGQSRRTVADGLVAESAAYSVLQSGPEFARWRAARPVRPPGQSGPRVRVEREAACLRVTLTRPDRRNALDAQMRDELLEGLGVAEADPSITTVEVRGDGPSFSAGGDLDEFGSRPDPASAHLIRLHRSVARAMADLGQRTTVVLHGAAVGSGIELAAFAGTVLAQADTQIALPEIALGLIPGAGGTVSLPLRIGRHRTAWLALSGHTIGAATALEWGLVDRLID
jgi:Enoyl-CoA hydratase/isomerase